jgi:D-alanyl-D-alanine carboxypeptidase (penicillin-binding protein 5/6)
MTAAPGRWLLVALVLLLASLQLVPMGLAQTKPETAAAPAERAATAEPEKPDFTSLAPHAILIDAGSGEVLYEKDPDTLIAPASMAKIMTAIVAFDALKRGEVSLDDEFTVSTNAWKKGGAPSGGSTMFAAVNSKISLHNLLMGALTVSGNDACIVIAEGLAGSEQAFAAMMTETARRHGWPQSIFTNATGLPDPRTRTTVRELAEMARYLIHTYPDYYRTYFGNPEFTWNKITQRNRNPLLGVVAGVDGLKTGYTKEAGYGLVASAERNGRRLILVVSGLKSAREREEEAGKLLSWGFRRFRTVTLFEANAAIGRARVWGGDRSWTSMVAHEPVRLMISNDERKRMTAELIYESPLYAPVKVGQRVGTLQFSLDGKKVSAIPLYAGHPVQAADGMLRRAVDTLSLMMFGS